MGNGQGEKQRTRKAHASPGGEVESKAELGWWRAMDYGLCRRCLATPAVKAARGACAVLSLPGSGRGGGSGASSFRWSVVDMVKLSKEAKQRLQQLFKGGQFAIRWGFIPLVIYLGQWLKNLGGATGRGLVGLSLFFGLPGRGKETGPPCCPRFPRLSGPAQELIF